MARDSYRPARQPSSLADRVTFGAGGGDSYRPGGQGRNNKSEFTFTSGRQGISFPPDRPGDSDIPRGPKRKSGRGGKVNNQRNQGRFAAPGQNGGRREHNQSRRGGHRPFRKEAPHERKILLGLDGAEPERTLGVTNGVNRFMNLDDLSASEDEMDIEDDDDAASTNESPTEDQDGRHKIARVQSASRADGDSVPKWSNPDPYTVLPPPNESTGKKRDFVQLIRKAKNDTAEKLAAGNPVASNDDFISFGDDDDEAGPVQPTIPPPPPPPPRGLRPQSPPPPPPPPEVPATFVGSLNDVTAEAAPAQSSRSGKRSAQVAGLPERPQHPGSMTQKRKRGQHEGGIIADWLPDPYSDSAPWCKNDGYAPNISKRPVPDYEKMLMLFHNEVMDFYDFVQPDRHETRVRSDLIQRIERCIGRRNVVLPDSSRVVCFGSFPAGLYLPTADMDLVLVSDTHFNGGPRQIDFDRRKAVTNTLFSTARKLQYARIADPSWQAITKAKVPIVKFVDCQTGIKVDLSFENLSGVEAQDSFKQWKTHLPDLLPMVALVKQFLLMRNLNDVHTGGLGGFSTICLVYHHLYQEIPQDPGAKPKSLGELFLGFLNFYGNQFDLATQRLEMAPTPRVVPKQTMGIDGRPEKPDGLSIQDPHNPENNISGGSQKAKHVFRAFSDAHKVLHDRLSTLDLSGTSVLECILGGNYESYRQHRDRLRRTS